LAQYATAIGHREGVETVVLGECAFVTGDAGQLEEQLIPLMVLNDKMGSTLHS
jgi:hypothetical protein